MKLGSILRPITFSFLLSLSGCGNYIEQIREKTFNILDITIETYLETSEEYMNLHKLITDEQYGEAEKKLEKSLQEGVNEGYQAIGMVRGTNTIPEYKKQKIIETLEQQVNKIENYLETTSAKE